MRRLEKCSIVLCSLLTVALIASTVYAAYCGTGLGLIIDYVNAADAHTTADGNVATTSVAKTFAYDDWSDSYDELWGYGEWEGDGLYDRQDVAQAAWDAHYQAPCGWGCTANNKVYQCTTGGIPWGNKQTADVNVGLGEDQEDDDWEEWQDACDDYDAAVIAHTAAEAAETAAETAWLTHLGSCEQCAAQQ